VIVSQYDIYVKDTLLYALPPPNLQVAMRSLFVVSLRKTTNFRPYFTATDRIVIRLQIGELEVKEHVSLHLLCI